MQFDSPTNLHCSQTCHKLQIWKLLFDSPTNLHCSQTVKKHFSTWKWFDSPTNLHCSQTAFNISFTVLCLIPLRICTALKQKKSTTDSMWSLIPLRICTALKQTYGNESIGTVWFPYEFALLSNISLQCSWKIMFDSPTNLHCSQTPLCTFGIMLSLIPLRICTALKQTYGNKSIGTSLIPLRICTALKLYAIQQA